MKKILWLLPFIVAPVWGAMADCFVGNGTPENPFVEGDSYVTGDSEVDGVLLLEAAAAAPDDATPTVAGGNILTTGVNTVPTAITDLDDPIPGATYTLICGDVANASTIADAGFFTLNGPWNPTTIGDSIVLYCFADDDYREVSRSYAATGPGIFTTVDGTDATFTGFINGDGSFNFGQTAPDQHTGYKDRSDYITFQDDFTVSVDTEYILDWDLTTVVGGGSNTVSVRPGWSELVTGGAGVDSESTRSWGLTNDRAFTPRIESVVELTNLVTQRFEWGFWAGAAEYVLIVYDVAVGAGTNWILQVDDTTGVETIDSGIAATVNPTKLEIRVAADGTVTWAIDDVVMTVVGLTNQMTANPHYTWWELTDTAAAAHTVAVDYVQIEQLKQQ